MDGTLIVLGDPPLAVHQTTLDIGLLTYILYKSQDSVSLKLDLYKNIIEVYIVNPQSVLYVCWITADDNVSMWCENL